MSLKVGVILEDHTYDKYVVCPIVEAICRKLGRPRAKIIVVTRPALRGVSGALNVKRLEAAFAGYRGSVDLFVLVVDRDGVVSRRDVLDN